MKNTSVLVSIDGRTATTAKVSSVRVEGVPSRDGVADVSFKLIGKILPDDSPRTVYIKIVAAPSGTTAWIPVKVKG